MISGKVKPNSQLRRRTIIVAVLVIVILFIAYYNYFTRIKRTSSPFPNGSVATALTVNHSGAVLVTGEIWRTTTVPFIGRILMVTPAHDSVYYVTSFNKHGELVSEGTFIAADSARVYEPTGIVESSDGGVYIAGGYFDLYSTYAVRQSSNNDFGAFLMQCRRGNDYKTWGGPGSDCSIGLTINSNDELYVIGTFEDTVDFDPSGGLDIRVSNGSYDIFLSKFDLGGNFKNVHTWGGIGKDAGFAICCDEQNNIYFVGYFSNVLRGDLLDDTEIASSGDKDCLAMKMNGDGSLDWIRTWGGSGMDECLTAANNNSGGVVTAGTFTGTIQVETVNRTVELVTESGSDIFVAQLDGNGDILSVFQVGCTGDNTIYGIASDSTGAIYLTGSFKGSMVSENGRHIVPIGSDDVYVVKYSSEGELLWLDTWGSPDYVSIGRSIVVDGEGNVYAAGTSEEHSFVRVYNSDGEIIENHSELEVGIHQILNPDVNE